MKLPTDSKARKGIPMFSGLIKYFPLALAKVASVSQEGNDQHNPGKPLHWDRAKSKDQMDALVRHVTDVAIEDGLGNESQDETLHALAQVAWRALAELQLRLEKKSVVQHKPIVDQLAKEWPPCPNELWKDRANCSTCVVLGNTCAKCQGWRSIGYKDVCKECKGYLNVNDNRVCRYCYANEAFYASK